MAHGSKKWIVDATGHYKKSRDRTKKDYYAAVKHWDEYGASYTNRRGKRYKAKNFCPQCKGIQKEYDVKKTDYVRLYDTLRAAYDREYGEAVNAWHKYDYGIDWYYDEYLNMKIKLHRKVPKMPRPPQYWTWESKNRGEVLKDILIQWSYHWRNTLCYKHERWYEAQRNMWSDHVNGKKANYRSMVKLSRMYYRAEVKNIMQRAKYIDDYEGYDDILPRVKEWLD